MRLLPLVISLTVLLALISSASAATVYPSGSIPALVVSTSLGSHGPALFDNNTKIEDALSTGTLLVNRTSTLTGTTTLAVTNQTASLLQANTTLLSATVKPVYWLKPVSAHVGLSIVPPPVAEMTNSSITFINLLAVTNDCHVIIDGSASENINGAATIYATAKYAAVTIKSTGTEWVITGSSLTWT